MTWRFLSWAGMRSSRPSARKARSTLAGRAGSIVRSGRASWSTEPDRSTDSAAHRRAKREDQSWRLGGSHETAPGGGFETSPRGRVKWCAHGVREYCSAPLRTPPEAPVPLPQPGWVDPVLAAYIGHHRAI